MGRALKILIPLYFVFVFLNLYPPMPDMQMADVIKILAVALTQTACAGSLVLMIALDPGKSADEPSH